MHEPKVSVLVPSYNQEDVIQQTLCSALEQDYPHLEVVVADDASRDQTPAILKDLQDRYPDRLKVFLYEKNLGVTGNHTRGLMQCTGEFITFLDGDDLFLPGKVRKQVEYMSANPDCGLCYHDVDVFDSDTGEVLYAWSQRFGRKRGSLRTLVRYGNYVPAVSVMVRRKDLPAHGYDDRIRVGSDWLLWLEVLSRGGKMGYLDETLARYRRHAGNMTNTTDWKFEDLLVTLGLITARWPRLAFAARLRQSEVIFTRAVQAVSQKETSLAVRLLMNSFVLGLPLFLPGLRLIRRELRFVVRNKRNRRDDILGGLIRSNR